MTNQNCACPCIQCLLSVYYLSSTVLVPDDTEVNKSEKNSSSRSLAHSCEHKCGSTTCLLSKPTAPQEIARFGGVRQWASVRAGCQAQACLPPGYGGLTFIYNINPQANAKGGVDCCHQSLAKWNCRCLFIVFTCQRQQPLGVWCLKRYAWKT